MQPHRPCALDIYYYKFGGVLTFNGEVDSKEINTVTVIPDMHGLTLALCSADGSRETNVMAMIVRMQGIKLVFHGAVGSKENNIMALSQICIE